MSKVKIKKDRENETVPNTNTKKLLCIVLKENKSTDWKLLSIKKDKFSLGGHTYFVEPSGAYLSKNGILTSVYVEGSCLPINHSLLEKETKTVEIKDRNTGKIKKKVVTFIKSLKFDSKIADILVTRNITDSLTRKKLDKTGIAVLVLLLFNLVIGIIAIAVEFT